MEVLLIVDLQNDFLPEGSLAIPHSGKIIPVINQLIRKFPLVIASKDEHPPKHISFASTHNRSIGEVIEGQKLWPDHCIAGTLGASFSSLLEAKSIKKIFKKGTRFNADSYSAFFNDSLQSESTGLNEFLKEEKVSKIFITGLVLEYCVVATALDAQALGYQVALIEEGIAGLGSFEEQDHLWRQLEIQNIRKISVKSFI